MMAWASGGGVSGPKFMVPRQRRLTLRPERPRWMYSMSLAFHGAAISLAPMPGYAFAGTAGRRAVAARAAAAHVHERPPARGRLAEPAGRRLPLGQQHG